MLDGVDPRAESRVDAFRAMRVSSDFLAQEMRGADNRLELIIEELLSDSRTDSAQHSTRRRDLDDVRPTLDLRPHRFSATVGSIGDTFIFRGHFKQSFAIAVHIAMPARRRDRMPRTKNPRPSNNPAINRVAQSKRGVLA